MSSDSREQTMLIAYDGSDHAKRAIEYAGRFLAAHKAVVLTAWEPPDAVRGPQELLRLDFLDHLARHPDGVAKAGSTVRQGYSSI